MQDILRQSGHAAQTHALVEVPRDRRDATNAQSWTLVRPVRQCEQAVSSGQERSGAECHVPAAHDQQSSHFRSVKEFCRLPAHAPRKDQNDPPRHHQTQ